MANVKKDKDGKPISKEFESGATASLLEDGKIVCDCIKFMSENKCGHRTDALKSWAAAGLYGTGGAAVAPVQPALPVQPSNPVATDEPMLSALPTEATPVADKPNGTSNGGTVRLANSLEPAKPVNLAKAANERLTDFLQQNDFSPEFVALPETIQAMQTPIIKGLPTSTDWTRVIKLASVWFMSGFVPLDNSGKPIDSIASLATKILYGGEIGLDPFEALRWLYTVHGRVGMHADGMLAVCHRKIRGFRIVWEERSNKRAALRVWREGQASEGMLFEFTEQDAIDAELTTGKNAGTYRKWKKNMLGWRCISDMVRVYCSDALGSVYTPEELEEIPTQVPQTPAPPPVQPGSADPTEKLPVAA